MVWRPQMYERTRFYGFAALGYTHNPLRSGTVTDSDEVQQDIDNPVQGQLITYLVVGTEIAKRVGFNLALPVLAYKNAGADPAPQVGGGGIGDNPVALHDLRLDARVQAYESDNRRLRLGGGGALFIPTGNAEAFASDDAASAWLYGSGELDFEKFFISGMVGPHFKPHRSIGGTEGNLYTGSELRWAFGAYLPLRDGRVRLGAELWGTTGLEELGCPDDCQTTVFSRKNTDLEWLAQARFTAGERQRVYWQVGGGTRLAAGYGAPDFRLLASIGTYMTLTDFDAPAPPRKLRVVGDVDDYAKDTDKDGYPDDIDQCPTIKEDGQPPDPTDGCPAGSDRDGDGIPDIDDACPDKPEDKDGIQDEDGCPEVDADNDEIPDTEDKCPTEPGPRNKIAEKNGCPGLTKVTEEGTVELLRPIEFEFGKATIKPVSYEILDEVVTLMKARGEIRIGVYGHTDNVGADATNLELSKTRAASVVKYLVSKGIADRRLESEGFGESKPVTSNATPAGRAKNRRVDFKILGE